MQNRVRFRGRRFLRSTCRCLRIKSSLKKRMRRLQWPGRRSRMQNRVRFRGRRLKQWTMMTTTKMKRVRKMRRALQPEVAPLSHPRSFSVPLFTSSFADHLLFHGQWSKENVISSINIFEICAVYKLEIQILGPIVFAECQGESWNLGRLWNVFTVVAEVVLADWIILGGTGEIYHCCH